MGHNRLQVIAQTRPWREVVGTLENPGSRTAEVAAVTQDGTACGRRRRKRRIIKDPFGI